jgi:hypothetical protein
MGATGRDLEEEQEPVLRRWPYEIQAVICDVDETLLDTWGMEHKCAEEILGSKIDYGWWRSHVAYDVPPSQWRDLLSYIPGICMTREEFRMALTEAMANISVNMWMVAGADKVIRKIS